MPNSNKSNEVNTPDSNQTPHQLNRFQDDTEGDRESENDGLKHRIGIDLSAEELEMLKEQGLDPSELTEEEFEERLLDILSTFQSIGIDNSGLTSEESKNLQPERGSLSSDNNRSENSARTGPLPEELREQQKQMNNRKEELNRLIDKTSEKEKELGEVIEEYRRKKEEIGGLPEVGFERREVESFLFVHPGERLLTVSHLVIRYHFSRLVLFESRGQSSFYHPISLFSG